MTRPRRLLELRRATDAAAGADDGTAVAKLMDALLAVKMGGPGRFVDVSMTDAREILFNAGTHEDTIQMSFSDFVRLVEPTICCFTLAPTVCR